MRVRDKGVEWLTKLNNDDLCDLLPQLVQVSIRGGRTALTFAANYFWDQIKRSTKGAWFCHVCYSMYRYLCTYVQVHTCLLALSSY